MKLFIFIALLTLSACGPRQLIREVSCTSADSRLSYKVGFYPDDRNITSCQNGTQTGQGVFNYDGDAVRYKQFCSAGGIEFRYENGVGTASDGTPLTCL